MGRYTTNIAGIVRDHKTKTYYVHTQYTSVEMIKTLDQCLKILIKIVKEENEV